VYWTTLITTFVKVGAERTVCSRLNFFRISSSLLEMATIRVFVPVILKRLLIKLVCVVGSNIDVDVIRGDDLEAIWLEVRSIALAQSCSPRPKP